MLWEGNIISQNVGKGSVAVLSFEGCSPKQHLVNQYAQSPPINRTRVSTALDNFWRNILLSSHK